MNQLLGYGIIGATAYRCYKTAHSFYHYQKMCRDSKLMGIATEQVNSIYTDSFNRDQNAYQTPQDSHPALHQHINYMRLLPASQKFKEAPVYQIAYNDLVKNALTATICLAIAAGFFMAQSGSLDIHFPT